jgi:hypothetical protein
MSKLFREIAQPRVFIVNTWSGRFAEAVFAVLEEGFANPPG